MLYFEKLRKIFVGLKSNSPSKLTNGIHWHLSTTSSTLVVRIITTCCLTSIIFLQWITYVFLSTITIPVLRYTIKCICLICKNEDHKINGKVRILAVFLNKCTMLLSKILNNFFSFIDKYISLTCEKPTLLAENKHTICAKESNSLLSMLMDFEFKFVSQCW